MGGRYTEPAAHVKRAGDSVRAVKHESHGRGIRCTGDLNGRVNHRLRAGRVAGQSAQKTVGSVDGDVIAAAVAGSKLSCLLLARVEVMADRLGGQMVRADGELQGTRSGIHQLQAQDASVHYGAGGGGRAGRTRRREGNGGGAAERRFGHTAPSRA